jgi:osmotically-inducible protein OsmY
MNRGWLGIVAVFAVTGCGVIDQPVTHLDPEAARLNKARDAQIASGVRKAILTDQTMSVEARNLYVRSDNGFVTLRGAIGSEDERSKVKEIARNVGASRVSDEMQIMTESVASQFDGAAPKKMASESSAQVE